MQELQLLTSPGIHLVREAACPGQSTWCLFARWGRIGHVVWQGKQRRTPPTSTPLRNKKNLALRPSENFSSPSASSELVGLSSLPTNQVNRWQHLYPLAQSAHSAHSQPYSIGLLCQDLPQDRSHPQRHHWRSVRSNLVEMVPTPEKLSRSKWGSASKKIV